VRVVRSAPFNAFVDRMSIPLDRPPEESMRETVEGGSNPGSGRAGRSIPDGVERGRRPAPASGRSQCPGPRWRHGRRALVGLAGALLCLLASEGILRLVHRGAAPLLPYSFRDGRPSLPSRLDLRVSYYGQPVNHYATDAGGARVADATLAARDPTGDVLVVGDSQALGYAIDFEHTFASRVAARLIGDARAARILASPAMDPELAGPAVDRYRAGRKDRPRLVLLTVNLGNDLEELFLSGLGERGSTSGRAHSWLVENSFLYMDLILFRSHRLFPDPTPAGVNLTLITLRPDERVVLAREVDRLLAELAARFPDASRIAVVIIPTDVQTDPAEFKKYRPYYGTDAEFTQWDRQAESLADMMSAVEDYLAGLLERRHLTVFRLTEMADGVVPAQALFDRSSHHLTDRAHTLIADRIVEALQREPNGTGGPG
jgi:hypothetical protein